MKNLATLSFLILATSLFAAAPVRPEQKAQALVNQLRGQRNVPYAAIVEKLEALRAEPEFATNANARATVDRLAVEQCLRPPWTQSGRWDRALQTRIPGFVRRNLQDAEVSEELKIKLLRSLCLYLGGEQSFDEAEREVRGLLVQKVKRSKRDEGALHLLLSSIYRWQDRFPEAWKEVEAAVPLDFRPAMAAAYVLADATGEIERVEKLAMTCGDVNARLESLRHNERTRKMALEFVKDRKAHPHQRVAIVVRWFALDKSPMGEAARQAIRDIDMKKMNLAWAMGPFNSCAIYGDWAMLETIYKTFEGAKGYDSPGAQRLRIFAFASDGKRAEALQVARTNLTNTALAPLDRAKFEVAVAILTGADVEKVIAAAKLPHKETVQLTCVAARMALNWGYDDVAETLTARHSAYFVDYPQREIKVGYSEKPIGSIDDWRAMYDKLDRQVCDRPFIANLDALETDVATGRKIGAQTALDSKDVMIEISAVADKRGLHLFMLARDPNARAVEAGFANGVGNELYFAPGKYEPYVCFGTDPRTGLQHEFHTQYSNRSFNRIDMMGVKRKGDFDFESQFTDTDYVQHLFIAWDPHALKLPKDGSKWRFECHAFCPQGAYTLGGSGNVHNISKWCDLTFKLSAKNIAEIRRGVLYRSVKGWRSLGRLDRFEKWADSEIGDPEFYREVLKPLEAELMAAAKEVTLDMSDDAVNRVYDKALLKWRGISHEIDALRRKWLLERNCR